MLMYIWYLYDKTFPSKSDSKLWDDKFEFVTEPILHLHVFYFSVEGTAADRVARRVDTGHTRTVCSGTIADPFFM